MKTKVVSREQNDPLLYFFQFHSIPSWLNTSSFCNVCLFKVPPSIIGADTPGEIVVILNQEISLECRAKGFPFPDIHWFKDGK